MSKALKVIGTIAGVVASVAMFIPGAQPIAAVAAGISAAASIGSQALYKPPPVRGSVTNVLIAPDAPSPYVMGEGYYGGVMRHDVAYGATLKKVPNPYRWIVSVYSVGGPVQSISPRVELAATTSYYSGFLYTDTQLGLCPEASGLAPQFSGAPGWNTTTARLSGQAAIGWNLKFDKDGKVFSTGVPRLGAYGQWVKVYDPRKDSTFPGGSGSHRLGVESTYEWSQNPALHAGTYSFGRWQNGKRVFGIGMPGDGIDFVGIAAWANVCDANSWTIFGVAYEPSNRWENLNDICAAGGGRPVFANGKLSWLWSAPKVPLDTITDADIADDNYSVTAMTSWRDRLNSVVPKYRSPEHDWEMVPQAAAVSIPDYVTEDGELKQVEWPFNFVKSANQAAVLAAYKLLDSRELQPITLPCLPRLRKYRPGECLHIELPELGLDTDAIILTREFDPARMIVTFTFMGETPGKHDFALGRTGTPPPTPALKQTVEERDLLRWSAMLDQGARTVEYDPDTVYSEGMTARMPDGSTWEYINTAPSSGNPPPDWPTTTNGYWSNLTPPIEFQAPTDISPTPPLELPEGTLWIAPDGHPYRFGTRLWIGADGEPWIAADGEPWLGSGYTDVQDQVGVTAKDIADAVTAQVARIADDGWLTAGEKSGLVHSHKALIENYVALNAKAIAIGEAATERANATAAVNSLNAYLVSLSPAWNDTTQDTAADADTITSLWGDAAQKVALLQAAIQGLQGPAGADGAPGTPGTDGVDGIDGEDGKLIEFVWKRAPTEPAAPTGNGIPSGWSDDPPEGTDPLWMSKAKQELDGTLVAGEAWSDPIRHDGPPGADGAAGFSVSPPAKSYIIACSANGTPKSGELPKTISFTVLQGSADLSDDAGTTYSVVNVDCTAAMGGTNGKVWTCTAIGADTAKSTVTVIRNGDTIAIVEIELAKARDGYGAIALHDNTLTINNSGSYTGSQGGPITMTVGPGGTIKANAFINYSTTGSLTKLAGKIQYRTTPGSGSWVDLTSEVQDPFGAQINEPSALSVSGSVAGPNPAANWEFQFVNRRYSGSSTLNVDAGDFSTEWSGS